MTKPRSIRVSDEAWEKINNNSKFHSIKVITYTDTFDRFEIDEDIRDRAFAIDIWDADVIAKPAREEDY